MRTRLAGVLAAMACIAAACAVEAPTPPPATSSPTGTPVAPAATPAQTPAPAPTSVPALTIDPSGSDLGLVDTGHAEVASLGLSNVGDGTVADLVAGIEPVEGSGLSVIGFDLPCQDGRLEAGEACAVLVRFDAGEPSSSATATVAVTGTTASGAPTSAYARVTARVAARPALTWRRTEVLMPTSGDGGLAVGSSGDKSVITVVAAYQGEMVETGSRPQSGAVRTYDEGTTWSRAATLRGWMADVTSSAADIYVALQSGRCRSGLALGRTRITGQSGTWSTQCVPGTGSGTPRYDAAVAATGADVHVAWSAGTNGLVEVRSSLDRGQTWTRQSLVGSGGARPDHPGVLAVSAEGDLAAIVFEIGDQAELAVSTDRGATWSVAERFAGGSVDAVAIRDRRILLSGPKGASVWAADAATPIPLPVDAEVDEWGPLVPGPGGSLGLLGSTITEHESDEVPGCSTWWTATANDGRTWMRREPLPWCAAGADAVWRADGSVVVLARGTLRYGLDGYTVMVSTPHRP